MTERLTLVYLIHHILTVWNLIIAVIGHICVFGSGLLGGYLFQFFVEDDSFPSEWLYSVQEIIERKFTWSWHILGPIRFELTEYHNYLPLQNFAQSM